MDSFSESDFTDSSSDVEGSRNFIEEGSKGAIETSNSQKNDIAQNSLLEPVVGMFFYSEDEAYNFYNSYAKRKGFSVRKGHISRRSDGSVRSRSFLCSNEGMREKHPTHITRKPRAIERTNCLARIEFKVDRESTWIVSKVILEHNHLLTSPDAVHMLRSQKKSLRGKRGINEEFDRTCAEGNQITDTYVGNSCGNGYFMSSMNYQSSCLHHKRTRDLEKGDAQILLDFLKCKQSEDPSFFYAIQLDEMERLTNFFWVDTRSVIDYVHFGDVVLFDTTYQINKCDLPFALFTGVNHHKQIIVFGAAILLDESIESFVWLFKTFLFAMSGKQPKTLFTDNCSLQSQAISMVFPNTCHRLCLWQIHQNSLKHLSAVYNNQPNFHKEFRSCLYESGTEDDFHAGWNCLVGKYDLAGNTWLQNLLGCREKWALVYNRNFFCATLLTTQWSETMSSYFRELFDRKLPLCEFLQQYLKSVSKIRERELTEDFKSRHTKPVLLVDIPMLSEVAEAYTRLIYMDFEDEFKSQIACLCEHVPMNEKLYTFRISRPGERCCWMVKFNSSDNTVACSCKRFESMGILCMHALKVLNTNNILQLPPQYILKRWTKFANEEILNWDSPEALALRSSQICHKAISFARSSIVSKDALDRFEQGFHRLISEVNNISNGIDKDSSNDSLDLKRKRKCGVPCSSADIAATRNTLVGGSMKAGKTEMPSIQSEYESSLVKTQVNTQDRKHARLYYIPNAAHPDGFVKCTIFTSGPIQDNQNVASDVIKNLDIIRNSGRGSVLAPPTTVEQPRSLMNTVMSQHDLRQRSLSGPPRRQKSLSENVNLDINEVTKKQ